MLTRLADGADHVKVLDFGIAKVMVADEGGSITRADQVCGTPQYMSPEQATGTVVDSRADLYSVGAILYSMITGKLVFEGKNPMDFLYKHASEKPIAPHVRQPQVSLSPALDRLIMRALEKILRSGPKRPRISGVN